MAGLDMVGDKVMNTVGSFVILAVMITLAVALSPTIIDGIHDLGQAMTASNNTLTQTFGKIFTDFGEPIYWFAVGGGAFGAIYKIGKELF